MGAIGDQRLSDHWGTYSPVFETETDSSVSTSSVLLGSDRLKNAWVEHHIEHVYQVLCASVRIEIYEIITQYIKETHGVPDCEYGALIGTDYLEALVREQVQLYQA